MDLGKDVPIETVVERIREGDIKLVGLSALMTTTVQNMKATIQAVRDAGLSTSFMVGGAVLNEEYREFVGADYYAKDALESVAIAKRFFGIE
ncbi:cobalamin-dependent protein [Enterococcus rivorum]|uniref:cobalamin-dependent protein n=1 Tax=Enterococcus rivorum TaxID=762845 RepID=UPI0036347F3E